MTALNKVPVVHNHRSTTSTSNSGIEQKACAAVSIYLTLLKPHSSMSTLTIDVGDERWAKRVGALALDGAWSNLAAVCMIATTKAS